MKTKNRFAKISKAICPSLTDLYLIYPWYNAILIDDTGTWAVFEDTNEAIEFMKSNPSFYLHY